jgi:hypothetical protein
MASLWHLIAADSLCCICSRIRPRLFHVSATLTWFGPSSSLNLHRSSITGSSTAGLLTSLSLSPVSSGDGGRLVKGEGVDALVMVDTILFAEIVVCVFCAFDI